MPQRLTTNRPNHGSGCLLASLQGPRHWAVLFVSATLTLASSASIAQDLQPATGPASAAEIRGGAFTGAAGVVGVNQAAGDLNAQANVRAIAAGVSAGTAATAVRQRVDAAAPVLLGATTGRIGDQAFQNAYGLISINQSSGVANASLNSIVIGPGAEIDALNDEALASAGSRALTDQHHASHAGHRRLGVDDTAFAGARGVVQINQSAGVSNVTRNRVVVQTGR